MPLLHMETVSVRDTGNHLQQTSASLQQQTQQLNYSVQNLSNAWQGHSANIFTSESQSLLQQLNQLANASELLNQRLQREVDEWERVAGIFGSSAGGVIDGTVSSIGVGISSTAEGMGKEWNWGELDSISSPDLIVKEPSEVFHENYMKSMINREFMKQGSEDSDDLNSAMERFYANQPPSYPPNKNMKSILDDLAKARGEEPEAFYKQYKKYVQLYNNAPNKPHIDLSRHEGFLGSTVSLRYGQVVGEVFGIDPVFGALLNPTGGLVGPASDSYRPGVNDAIGYHGVFHDAGGYLYNEHRKIGPGYDYMNQSYLPTSCAGTGHVGGIKFWNSQPSLNEANIPVEIVKQLEIQTVKIMEDGTKIATDVMVQGADNLKNISKSIFGWPN